MGKPALMFLGLALATALCAAHAMNKNELITPPPAGGLELIKPQPSEPPRNAKGAPKKDAARVPPPVKTPAARPPQSAPAGRESK